MKRDFFFRSTDKFFSIVTPGAPDLTIFTPACCLISYYSTARKFKQFGHPGGVGSPPDRKKKNRTTSDSDSIQFGPLLLHPIASAVDAITVDFSPTVMIPSFEFGALYFFNASRCAVFQPIMNRLLPTKSTA